MILSLPGLFMASVSASVGQSGVCVVSKHLGQSVRRVCGLGLAGAGPSRASAWDPLSVLECSAIPGEIAEPRAWLALVGSPALGARHGGSHVAVESIREANHIKREGGSVCFWMLVSE